MRARRKRAESPTVELPPPPGWLAQLDDRVIDLLATGRIRCINEQAVIEHEATPIFETVHAPRRHR